MNDIHCFVLKHVRAAYETQTGIIAKKLSALSDDHLIRMMFASYRGKSDAKGLRLTNFGMQVLRSVFMCYEIKLPEGHKLKAPEILYLDHRATLPYFVSDEKIVVFETELGMKIKLADGDIFVLIEIEGTQK